MKTFYLLKLDYGRNEVINEVQKPNEGAAIQFYQNLYPELNLNNNGYSQHGHISYCIARKHGE